MSHDIGEALKEKRFRMPTRRETKLVNRCRLVRAKMADLEMMLAAVSAVLCLQTIQVVVSADKVSLGPGYKTFQQHCLSERDCDSDLGEVCWWLYDGCARGQCMCHPLGHIQDSSGRCSPVKLGNEACTAGDRCTENMRCLNGTCQCDQGRMHEDGLKCFLPSQKLLGQRCHPSRDVCYSKTAFSYSETYSVCGEESHCICKEGFKKEGDTCRNVHIEEQGCSLTYHCEGGALCLEGRCACPTGYRSVAKNTKCAKIGAVTELPIGARCDEINEEKYCSHGLVCHKCTLGQQYTCVRYLVKESERTYVARAGTMSSCVILTILMSLCSFLAKNSR